MYFFDYIQNKVRSQSLYKEVILIIIIKKTKQPTKPFKMFKTILSIAIIALVSQVESVEVYSKLTALMNRQALAETKSASRQYKGDRKEPTFRDHLPESITLEDAKMLVEFADKN